MDDNKNKALFRKIMIGLIPLLLGGMIFMIVFSHKGKDKTAQEQSVFLADSKADSVSSSKTAAYKADKEKQDKKKREEEDSKVMSNNTFYAVEEAPKKVQQQAPQTVAAAPVVSHNDAPVRTTSSSRRSVQTSAAPRPRKSERASESNEELTELEKLQIEAGIKTSPKKTSKETTTAQAVQEPTPKKVNTNPNGRSRGLSSGSQSHAANLISAVIHNDQVISNGSKVKIRLSESIVVDGVTIPRNSFVAGIATFSKTRMNIALSSIIVDNNIIPFNRSVYDKDGMEGIYLPDNFKSEAANEAGSDMVNGSLSTVTASMGVVGAAITSGKNLIRKSTTRQTVTLKANYKIFIK